MILTGSPPEMLDTQVPASKPGESRLDTRPTLLIYHHRFNFALVQVVEKLAPHFRTVVVSPDEQFAEATRRSGVQFASMEDVSVPKTAGFSRWQTVRRLQGCARQLIRKLQPQIVLVGKDHRGFGYFIAQASQSPVAVVEITLEATSVAALKRQFRPTAGKDRLLHLLPKRLLGWLGAFQIADLLCFPRKPMSLIVCDAFAGAADYDGLPRGFGSSSHYLLMGSASHLLYSTAGLKEKLTVIGNLAVSQALLAAGPFNTPARGHRIALFMQPLRPVSELYCPAYEKMIRDLIGWVARIKDARIVVKLHPQQTEFFVEESFTEPTIERTDGYQSETRNVELILGSRVVVTHCSSVAWLSMHLRRPVVFIHEGHQESHPLAAFGVSQISNGSDDLLRRVEMLLFDRQYFEKVIAEQSIEVARVMRADANVAKRLVESLKHAADSQHVA